ncbi:hypothetical protein P171DRAFT_500159 [Karstenula rhodostoma CBS 690.94]|uniref:C2H2-type domain-containing protein n=1 Tax=Karstenula rhodostoma CBS 690.94 TaxID=1392251 RepID=A0A9P4PCU5_9PLEO|nr:hypothetical protein P171DRAFT_500159 [Karstenula rhodostoma CBS 690.94]
MRSPHCRFPSLTRACLLCAAKWCDCPYCGESYASPQAAGCSETLSVAHVGPHVTSPSTTFEQHRARASPQHLFLDVGHVAIRETGFTCSRTFLGDCLTASHEGPEHCKIPNHDRGRQYSDIHLPAAFDKPTQLGPSSKLLLCRRATIHHVISPPSYLRKVPPSRECSSCLNRDYHFSLSSCLVLPFVFALHP